MHRDANKLGQYEIEQLTKGLANKGAKGEEPLKELEMAPMIYFTVQAGTLVNMEDFLVEWILLQSLRKFMAGCFPLWMERVFEATEPAFCSALYLFTAESHVVNGAFFS